MSSNVCDVNPCKQMARTIEHLAIATISDNFFELLVTKKDGSRVRLCVVYCPFCGSRVDESWVADFKAKRKR
jgi:hypothetical protein